MLYPTLSPPHCRYVTEMLLSHFPELGSELRLPEAQASLPRLFALFAAFTRQALAEGSLTTLKQCLFVADLLRRENDYLATAVQVAYLPRLHFDDDAYAAQLAYLLMPKTLYSVFCH